jgi:uncharacterized integral membrane protein
MIRIVVSVVLLVLLVVLVVMNVGFTTSVNLFGTRFENVPVVAVAALSFALGVVYSLFIYVGRFLHGRAKQRIATKKQSLAEREKALDARESEREAAVSAVREGAAPGAEPPGPGKSTGGVFSRILRALGSSAKPRE